MSALAQQTHTPPGAEGDQIASLMAQGAYARALSLLLPRLQTGQLDPTTLDQAASCYWYLEDADTALALLQVAVDQWPELAAGWSKLAAMAMSVGQSDRARAAVDQAMRRGVKSAGILALLNRLEPIARGSAAARRLKSIASAQSAPAVERATAMNTLGRIEDRAGRHRAAFRWFAASKRAHGERYRPREVTAMVAAQIVRFHAGGLPTQAEGMPRFVFVVGMPRSGTTLMETILARHDQVRALGESPALTKTVMAMRRHIAETRGTRSAWDWFGQLSGDEIAAFRQVFLSFLPAGAATHPGVLVSKMPLDCFDLGAARVLLPDARFIHMNRHPLDVGLSNYSTNFHQGNAFSRELDWMGHMIRSVARSSNDYRLKLGDSYRLQSYRGLIEAPDAQVREVLSHAGLSWQEACLHPEEGRHIVRTASLGQVREKINRKGLGKWEAYADQLTPLVDALGGWDWIEDWAEDDAQLAPATRAA